MRAVDEKKKWWGKEGDQEKKKGEGIVGWMPSNPLNDLSDSLGSTVS